MEIDGEPQKGILPPAFPLASLDRSSFLPDEEMRPDEVNLIS